MALKVIGNSYARLAWRTKARQLQWMAISYCHHDQKHSPYTGSYLENPGSLPALTVPVKLAGRKYLPGSWHDEFPQYLKNPQSDFPHVVRPSNIAKQTNLSLTDWADIVRQYLDDHLTKYGAILLRSLPIEDEKQFSEFVSQLRYTPQSYTGGLGYRKLQVKNVMTASDEPKEYSIELHNEMAYLPNWCDIVIFYCKIPPAIGQGGHTCIAKVSDYVDKLGNEITESFLKRGVRYQCHLFSENTISNDYLTWQQSFGTKEKKEVEEFCRQNGYTYKWDESDNFTYSINLPAAVKHNKTNMVEWFNQIYQHTPTYTTEHPSFENVDLPLDKHLCQCYYGDGGEIGEELLMHMRSVNWQSAVGFEWQAGDILFLDNVLAQHSRLSYEGPRRIFASLMNY